MSDTIQIGDRVRWNDYDYKRRKELDTQHTGTVIDICGDLAIVNCKEGQPSVPVYVHRLTCAPVEFPFVLSDEITTIRQVLYRFQRRNV